MTDRLQVNSLVPFLGTVISSSPVWSLTAMLVSSSWMVTVLPAWVMPAWMRWRDLDAAAAGDLSPDGQGVLWQRVWSGEADALEAVPLAGSDGTGRVRHRMCPG